MRQLLKNLELYALLGLAHGPLHGYGLATQIETDSEGQLKPLPGNLYVVLKRLERAGLVQPLESDPRDATRRRAYELTELGRRRLAAEAQRLATFASTVELRFSPGDER